jgi:hypothetical protein
MAKYFWRNGNFVDADGKPMPVPKRTGICAPHVISDIPEYSSPIDGRMITTRSQRRDDLKRNNCVEYEPSLSPTKGKFKNAAWCKKRGIQVSEEYRT